MQPILLPTVVPKDMDIWLHHGEHEVAHVILSILVAILGSWTALDLQQQIPGQSGRSRHYFLAAAAVAMGTSIFVMHFIAMLGFEIGIPITYDLETTFASWALAVAGTGAAFFVALTARTSAKRVAWAALGMGAAICLMHYVGMAAIRTTAVVSYSMGWVALSFIIAVCVSWAALKVGLENPRLEIRAVGAVLLGLAISSMHYSAMAAANFVPTGEPTTDEGLNELSLALWLGAGTLLLLFSSLVGAMFSRRTHTREVLQLQEDLGRASRVAAMGTMASTLAHELNQPLAAAGNYLAGAKRILEKQGGDSNDQVKHGINETQAQIERAGEIIRRVRLMLSDSKPERPVTSLDEIAAEAVKLVRAGGGCEKIRIDVNIANDARLVLGDPIQIDQILVNLLRNACEATRSVESPQVRISSCLSGNMVEVDVADNGPGLDRDPAELFNPVASSKAGGLGLGLSISRTIVEAHGGRMWGQNGNTKGALISFTIPAAEFASPESIH